MIGRARALAMAGLLHAVSAQAEDSRMQFVGSGIGGMVGLVLLIVLARLGLTFFFVNKEPYRAPVQQDSMAV